MTDQTLRGQHALQVSLLLGRISNFKQKEVFLPALYAQLRSLFPSGGSINIAMPTQAVVQTTDMRKSLSKT